MRNSGWSYSTTCPLPTQISTISPSISLVISFISFIASMMQSVSPRCTVSPTATNGLLSYMHLRSYILIALGIFLLDIYITVKYNKKLFKDSVRKTLRGGDGA